MFCKQVDHGCPHADPRGRRLPPRPSLGASAEAPPSQGQICPELSGIELKTDPPPQPPTLPFGVALFLLPFGRPRGLLGVGASVGSCWRESRGGVAADGGSSGRDACPEWLTLHPGMLQAGSPVLPADPARAGWYWEDWEDWLHWDRRSGARHRLLRVLQPGASVTRPGINRSAQPDGPRRCPSTGPQLAGGAAAWRSVGEPANPLFCGKTMCTNPSCPGGGSGAL